MIANVAQPGGGLQSSFVRFHGVSHNDDNEDDNVTTTMMITKTRLTNRKDYNEVNYANNGNEENNDEIVMTTINMRMRMSRMKTMILKKTRNLCLVSC